MTKLEYLFRRSRNRLINLREVSCTLPNVTHEAADKAVSYICIEALNLLGEFNRSYYILALGKVETRTGTIVSTKFPRGTSIHDALRSINKLKNPRSRGTVRRRDEPSWHTKSQFLDVIARSALNTEPQIRGALSLPVRVLEDLPTARNFSRTEMERRHRSVAVCLFDTCWLLRIQLRCFPVRQWGGPSLCWRTGFTSWRWYWIP